MWTTSLDTPIGTLRFAADAAGLRHVFFADQPLPAAFSKWAEDRTQLAATVDQFSDYFAGKRQSFDLPLAAVGTVFQQRVWTALRQIPYAQTCAYADIARSIEQPRAVRAVGAANGRNPLPIIVPCHRVIGRDGSLTGFAGGVDTKAWLLAHERRMAG